MLFSETERMMIRQLKKTILDLDKKYMGGAFADWHAKATKTEDFFHGEPSAIVSEPVSDLILMQTDERINRIVYASDPEAPLVCDRNLQIISGFGSLKTAYESGADLIETTVRDNELSAKNNNIAESEEILNIRRSCKEKTGNYYCILFPPAIDYFEEITEDIKAFDKENINVAGFDEFDTDKDDFSAFIKAVYSKDSIKDEDLEIKIRHILDVTEKYKVRIITIDVDDPRYRAKKDNGMPEPAAIIELKNAVRAKYRTAAPNLHKEYKYEYAHDVIIHTTDNFIINTACRDAVIALKQRTI